MGIEPTYPAWKAGVLPLNYARRSLQSTFYVLSHTVGVTGFEPATSWSQTRRSSQAEPHPGCFEIACSSSVFVPTAVEQREYHYKTHIGICQHFLQNFFIFFFCSFLPVFPRKIRADLSEGYWHPSEKSCNSPNLPPILLPIKNRKIQIISYR